MEESKRLAASFQPSNAQALSTASYFGGGNENDPFQFATTQTSNVFDSQMSTTTISQVDSFMQAPFAAPKTEDLTSIPLSSPVQSFTNVSLLSSTEGDFVAATASVTTGVGNVQTSLQYDNPSLIDSTIEPQVNDTNTIADNATGVQSTELSQQFSPSYVTTDIDNKLSNDEGYFLSDTNKEQMTNALLNPQLYFQSYSNPSSRPESSVSVSSPTTSGPSSFSQVQHHPEGVTNAFTNADLPLASLLQSGTLSQTNAHTSIQDTPHVLTNADLVSGHTANGFPNAGGNYSSLGSNNSVTNAEIGQQAAQPTSAQPTSANAELTTGTNDGGEQSKVPVTSGMTLPNCRNTSATDVFQPSEPSPTLQTNADFGLVVTDSSNVNNMAGGLPKTQATQSGSDEVVNTNVAQVTNLFTSLQTGAQLTCVADSTTVAPVMSVSLPAISQRVSTSQAVVSQSESQPAFFPLSAVSSVASSYVSHPMSFPQSTMSQPVLSPELAMAQTMSSSLPAVSNTVSTSTSFTMPPPQSSTVSQPVLSPELTMAHTVTSSLPVVSQVMSTSQQVMPYSMPPPQTTLSHSGPPPQSSIPHPVTATVEHHTTQSAEPVAVSQAVVPSLQSSIPLSQSNVLHSFAPKHTIATIVTTAQGEPKGSNVTTINTAALKQTGDTIEQQFLVSPVTQSPTSAFVEYPATSSERQERQLHASSGAQSVSSLLDSPDAAILTSPYKIVLPSPKGFEEKKTPLPAVTSTLEHKVATPVALSTQVITSVSTNATITSTVTTASVDNQALTTPRANPSGSRLPVTQSTLTSTPKQQDGHVSLPSSVPIVTSSAQQEIEHQQHVISRDELQERDQHRNQQQHHEHRDHQQLHRSYQQPYHDQQSYHDHQRPHRDHQQPHHNQQQYRDHQQPHQDQQPYHYQDYHHADQQSQFDYDYRYHRGGGGQHMEDDRGYCPPSRPHSRMPYDYYHPHDDYYYYRGRPEPHRYQQGYADDPYYYEGDRYYHDRDQYYGREQPRYHDSRRYPPAAYGEYQDYQDRRHSRDAYDRRPVDTDSYRYYQDRNPQRYHHDNTPHYTEQGEYGERAEQHYPQQQTQTHAHVNTTATTHEASAIYGPRDHFEASNVYSDENVPVYPPYPDTTHYDGQYPEQYPEEYPETYTTEQQYGDQTDGGYTDGELSYYYNQQQPELPAEREYINRATHGTQQFRYLNHL